MGIRMTVALGLVSVGVLWAGLGFSKEVPEGPTIKLERAVYFLSPDGADTVLAPGVYGVEAKDEKFINVTAVGGGETITIQAEAGTHEEQLSAPEALAVAQEEDLFHLVLLMPGGKTLDALGTLSGVRTRGSMMVPLQPQQLSQLALRPVPLAAPALVQAPAATPQMPQAPPIPNVPLQIPPQLQTQPLTRPDPRQAPTQANPQLDPCIQIVYDGGVKIDLKAVATGPFSVNLTWLGLPGKYEISTTGAGAGFRASTKLSPVSTRPLMAQGTLTHAPALPAFQYTYTITGTLIDGRKACGGAWATTLPAPLELLQGQPLTPKTPAAPAPLWGWVDLHTHPMSNLAFGGKLFHGGPDISTDPSDPTSGSLLPAVQMPYFNPQECHFDVRAANIFEALSDDAPTHGVGLPFGSNCGDYKRNLLIIEGIEGMTKDGLKQPGHAVGAVYPPGAATPPAFANWPKWNDVTHQKMWWEWIKRAHEGGLRVMVALSHNNRTLGDVVGPGNFVSNPPGSAISGPTDDMTSSDLQIAEIKAFVNRHSDFMKVAFNAADVYQIVQQGKIAIVLGVEIDNIGNFNQRVITPGLIEGEIQRLYTQGVRYIFPIHLTDNVFGDTAIYDTLFNLANYRETGKFWKVECADPGDEIGFKSPNVTVPYPFNQFIPKGVSLPQSPPCIVAPFPPAPPFLGHRNGRTAPPTSPTSGLTPLGETAIKAMMKLGMIIDIDHMSHRAAERTLQIAEGIDPGRGYPLMSGHSGIRAHAVEGFEAENSRTPLQLERIGCLQGMFGLGTDGADAHDWARQYVQAFIEISKTSRCPNKVSFGPGSVAFGTDTNSLVKSPRPTMPPDLKLGAPVRVGLYNTSGFPTFRSSTGGKTWDYNTEGVAHYGMYADFVKDVRTAPVNQGMTGTDLVDNHLMRSADYFWHMWQKIEAQKVKVP